MTRQEIEDMLPSLTFNFTHYYKYVFTYTASLPDGTSVYAYIGGDSNDIYRCDLNATETFWEDGICRLAVGEDSWRPGERKEESEG